MEHAISTASTFIGSYNEFPTRNVKVGDIIMMSDTQITYVCTGSDWEELSTISSISSNALQEERKPKKIVERCPSCNGALKLITYEDLQRGHVRCQYCESMINLYE